MKQRHPDWATIYDKLPDGELPWHYEMLDPDLAAALKSKGIASGTILDIGCGSGAQAELLAAMGFLVLGIDISTSAIQKAKMRAAPGLQFHCLDIVKKPTAQRFDHAFDRGCFHVLSPFERMAFVKNVHKSLARGGLLFLKCFSNEEPERDFGPLRFSLGEIAKEFDGYFTVVDCISTVFQGTKPHKPKSLFVTLKLQK